MNWQGSGAGQLRQFRQQALGGIEGQLRLLEQFLLFGGGKIHPLEPLMQTLFEAGDGRREGPESQRRQALGGEDGVGPLGQLLAAGLEGIREGLDPGDPNLVNAYRLSPEERSARGLHSLPRTLGEAIEAFAADPLARQVFGEAMADAYVAFKREEWSSYHGAVSAWETDRYLELF